MSNRSFKEILDAVIANNNMVIDDHDNFNKSMKLAGVAKLKHSGVAVALCDSRYFSLNRVYLDQSGVPHVSRESVAGVIKKDGISLQEAIEKYNEQQRSFNEDLFSIDDVTLF